MIQLIKSKIALTVIVSLLSSGLNALVKAPDTLSTKKQHPFGVDYYGIPLIAYNAITLGVNYQQNSKIEHCLQMGASIYILGAAPMTVNMSYNFNIYPKNATYYFPIWISSKNTIRSVYYEEGYFPNRLKHAIGTGIGRKIKLSGKSSLRLELNAGAAINLTNGVGGTRLLKNLNDYSFETQQPQYYPKFVPDLKFRVTFVTKF
ncbi:MAG: hypothetical protein IT236_09870 [Bacteroidia bacterium]|nr:hypothetical protein [Bacteroidia bacterium]